MLIRLLLTISVFFSILDASSQQYYLFVGTYTGGESKGIYVYTFNATNGELQWISNTDSCANPSFLAISPNGQYLYATNETGGAYPGRISAFAFDSTRGKLQLLNQQLSGGDAPCFIAIDASGKWVVAGNYSGGSISVFPVRANGSLAPYSQLIQHTGSSINKQRQEKAHVHATFFSPDGQYILSPDLGMDKTMLYPFNPKSATPLSEANKKFVPSTPGSGPRHLSFHPNGKYVYLIEEMSGTVSVFGYQNGNLRFLQTIATHPADYKGQPGSADIHVSPDGKFLYTSNRGEENNLAIFSIHKNSGELTTVGYQPVHGVRPRNFIIDPTGNYLLVANQLTNNIVVYRRDMETGLLQKMPQQIEVPSPVCLIMQKK